MYRIIFGFLTTWSLINMALTYRFYKQEEYIDTTLLELSSRQDFIDREYKHLHKRLGHYMAENDRLRSQMEKWRVMKPRYFANKNHLLRQLKLRDEKLNKAATNRINNYVLAKNPSINQFYYLQF